MVFFMFFFFFVGNVHRIGTIECGFFAMSGDVIIQTYSHKTITIIFNIFPLNSGWWFQPLWKIWKSLGMRTATQAIWEKKKWQPNHQPAIIFNIFPLDSMISSFYPSIFAAFSQQEMARGSQPRLVCGWARRCERCSGQGRLHPWFQRVSTSQKVPEEPSQNRKKVWNFTGF